MVEGAWRAMDISRRSLCGRVPRARRRDLARPCGWTAWLSRSQCCYSTWRRTSTGGPGGDGRDPGNMRATLPDSRTRGSHASGASAVHELNPAAPPAGGVRRASCPGGPRAGGHFEVNPGAARTLARRAPRAQDHRGSTSPRPFRGRITARPDLGASVRSWCFTTSCCRWGQHLYHSRLHADRGFRRSSAPAGCPHGLTVAIATRRRSPIDIW